MSTFRAALLALSLTALAGCGGGTKLVKRPTAAPERLAPLALARDGTLEASLDWVLVRNAPGAWAKNADWDEYFLRVANASGRPLHITRVAVVDSAGSTVLPLATRKSLVAGSKATVKRYRKSGLKVRAGVGGAGLVAAGVGTTVLGVGAATAAATSSALSGGAAGGGAAAGGLLLAGPAIAVYGIVRAVRNRKVNAEIVRRASPLPADLAPGASAALDLFFPLAPAPQRVEISYDDGTGSRTLVLDTRAALDGLHLKPAAAPPSR